MSRWSSVAVLGVLLGAGGAWAQGVDLEGAVELCEVSEEGVRVGPVGVVWVDGAPRIQEASWDEGEEWVRVWSEGEGGWEPMGVQGLNRPGVSFVAGGKVRMLWSTSNYGGALLAFEVSQDGKQGEPVVLARTSGEYDRLTVSGVCVEGDVVGVFGLWEKGESPNQLVWWRSDDGGETWSEPVFLGETTMSEDVSRLGVLSWSEERFARFVVEREEGVRLVRTEDGGETWVSEPVPFELGLGEDAMVLPLGVVQTEERVLALALGFSEETESGGYYLLEADAEAREWSEARFVVSPTIFEDPVLITELAAVGDTVAFAFTDVYGSWTEGEFGPRVFVSGDGGHAWEEQEVGAKGLISLLSADPESGRMIFCGMVGEEPRRLIVAEIR